MRSASNRAEFERVLKDLIDELDVPPSRYDDARERYEAVGGWLDAEGSPLAQYRPEIYAQGSFALGTVVKPIGDDEYDVDAVCRLARPPLNISQKALKNLVGDRLKNHATYAKMLDPKEGRRRCWTLRYADESRFHLDVCPALPDNPTWLVQLGVPPDLAAHALRITDKTTWDHDIEWPKSNPKGYVLWFRSRMKVALREARRVVALQKSASVEDIPDDDVRTPLQRVIQILKRHRDVQFPEDDDKPISIVISTLAATVYENEPEIVDALLGIVPRMRAELMRQRRGTTWWVANPVNPRENFADKWLLTPRKAEIFLHWLDAIEAQHEELLSEGGFEKLGEYLTESYGAREASKTIARYAGRPRSGALVKSAAAMSKSMRELTTFDLAQREPVDWPVNQFGRATLQGHCKSPRGKWAPLANNGRHVLRGSELRFKATTNVAEPFDVYWQVVNTGRDARNKNDLRGKFEPPSSDAVHPLVRDESAKYRGRHCIECFIVQRGACVARSGEFTVNII